MNKRYIPLLITLLFLGVIAGDAFGQEIGSQRRVQSPKREKQARETMMKIESVVKDANGNAVPNVLISGKEGAIEVLSDGSGNFSITVPEGSDLLFEGEGYETIAMPANEAKAAITLNKADFLMEDKNKVNIAFGQVRKKELIGAVSTVDVKQLKKYDDTESFYDALTGKIPGLLGNNNIRGLEDALIVVDGVPRDPSMINISEIESISVLKDGNAAMLWGSRAKNGVIVVTTRRGTPFKRKIDVSVEKGYSTPIALPKYLGSGEYFKYYNEALMNDGLAPNRADSTITHYLDGRNPYRYPSLDYYSSEFLKSSKPFQRILAEMSGGNASTQYYTNIGWNREGTLYNLGEAADMTRNRFNMRGNVNFQVNEYIKSSVDAVFIFDLNKRPNGNFWGDASTNHPDYFSPLLPISAVRRTATLNGQVKAAKKIEDAYILGGTSQYTNNPYGIMFRSGDNTDNQRTATVNTSIEADLRNITKGLKFKAYMSIDLYNHYQVSTSPTYAVYNPTWQRFGHTDSISGLAMTGTDVNTGTQNIPTSLITRNGVQTTTPYFERRIGAHAMLDYDRTFNEDHHVTGTLLAYWDKFKINNILIDQKDAHIGLRATYGYKQKYLVDFTSTYTNGFRLAPGSKGGYAPSLALAWNLSEEGFLKGSETVDFLKLRASASIQNIDPNLGTEWTPYKESFQADVYYTYADGLRGGSSQNLRGVTLMRSDNYGLTFEQMKSVNAGVEGYFFDRLLYIDANVFTQRWEGQVIRRTSEYPSWIANNNPYTNNNITGYTGGELGITLSKTIGKFAFSLGGNMLYQESKAVKLSEIRNETYQYRQGRSTDAMFGLVALGLFRNETDIFDSPAQQFSEVRPGDIKYKDINDDGLIDSRDAIEIGNSQARFSYGLNFLVKYGGLSLMATGDGRSGYNYNLSGAYFWIQGNDKYSEEILNRWTPETAETATYPRLTSKASTNNYQTSTYWMQDGSYFRLNRVQLTYEFPKSLLRNCPTKEISLYVRGSNLQMWSTKSIQRQLNIGAEPDYRSYALGVNILF